VLETIQLEITSIIHSFGQSEPEVIKQQMVAELFQVEEREQWQISYLEGTEREQSSVRLYASPEELVVKRLGPMNYEQVYQPDAITTYQLSTPTGVMEIQIKTHFYIRDDRNIRCGFSLFQVNNKIGDYQLQLDW
jgi:uncharacterized beta-barrel protein YwiB (DUF1934 family)